MQRSSLFRAGHILLLVGAILQAVGALFLIGAAIVLAIAPGPGANPFTFIAVVYLVLGVAGAVGAVLAFVGFSASSRGEARRAFAWGLAGSLVPPVAVVTLIGAILCRVSPEGEQPSVPHPHPV